MPTEIRNAPTKQPFERLDRDLDLPATFRAGQQQAAYQGTKGHRQAGGSGGKPGPNHDQQTGRDKRFLTASPRHAAE